MSKEDIASLFLHKKIVRKPGQELMPLSGSNHSFFYSKQPEKETNLEPPIARNEELQITSQALEKKDLAACTPGKPKTTKDQSDNKSNSEKPCWTCQTPTTKTCGKCSFGVYCSKYCQAKDWAHHKLFCASFPKLKNLQDTPQDMSCISLLNPVCCIGLLLPVCCTQPAFVRVPKVSGQVNTINLWGGGRHNELKWLIIVVYK